MLKSIKKIITFFGFCTFITNAGCQSTVSTDRINGWRSDIDTLIEKVKTEHYIYSKQPLRERLITEVQDLKKNVPVFSDERMLIELQRLMFQLGDGHCYVLPFGASKVDSRFLPLHFYQFSDGLFIIDADSAHKKLIGCQVLKIGPVIPEKFMGDMTHFISEDNTMGALWIGPFFLRFHGMLESYGLNAADPTVTMTMKTTKGDIVKEDVDFVPVPRLRGIPKLVPSQLPGSPPPPLYLYNLHSSYWMKELPEDSALYFEFNQVMNDPVESLASFSNDLDNVLQQKNIRTLIVDVRNNNGGNGELIDPLLKVLEKFDSKGSGRKLYVITGRNTFSAAQIFISLLNRNTHAVFAGEPSSSKPNFVGEENDLQLPWSGALCSISNRYHESIPGDKRQWIEPEIQISLSSADYFANRDPVLTMILKASR